MPLHDWTDERGWDSVHPVWRVYLLEHIQERLPDGYKALIVSVPEPDLEILDTPHRAVHIDFHGQLIAALELVSPRNKDRADAKETHTNRYLGYLRLGISLMIVDMLPRPGNFSFSDAITSALGMELPPMPAPFAASYRVGEPVPEGTLVSGTGVRSTDGGKTWDFDHPYEFYNPGRPISGRGCPKTITIDKENLGTVSRRKSKMRDDKGRRFRC